MKRLLSFLLLSFAISGCVSQNNFSVKSLGNRVLEFTGILPATRTFEAAKGLGNSTENLTAEQEYFLGRAVAAKIVSIYPISEDRRLTAYVNLVGQAVLSFTDTPETFSGYHFVVLKSSEFNAISAPSGFIFVSQGMIEKMPDEDALAAVLAHEISHVQLKHGIKSISKKRLDTIIADLGKLAGSLQCNELLQSTTGVFSGVVGDLVQTLVQKGYSREQELEADRTAARFLQSAGYSPLSVVDMLSVLALQGEHGNRAGWFSTHPVPGDRIAALSDVVQSMSHDAGARGKSLRAQRFEVAIPRTQN